MLYSPLVLIYIIIISHKMRDRIEMTTAAANRILYHISMTAAIHLKFTIKLHSNEPISSLCTVIIYTVRVLCT